MKRIYKVVFALLFTLSTVSLNEASNKCPCGHTCTDDCLVDENNNCVSHDCDYSIDIILEDKGPIG